MTAQQIIATVLTLALAGWLALELAHAHQWPLVVGLAVVPGGALVHAVILARRQQHEAVDVLLTWVFAATVAFAAFADAAIE